ncbi:DNRLRE domain-containing protein [Nonomuraea sp. NPDC050022]|uniref:DNRLRE domain-containing protein n=1 Tax=unclassified Nonomuraea TaxID=2593643 RepID=UPI0033D202A3
MPELDELIEPLSDELIAANEGQRDSGGTLIGVDKLSPAVPDPGDSDDTTNPDGEDTTPPRVVATEPSSGATDVSLGSQLGVTFSEEIFDPEFVVKSTQGAQIQGTTLLDATKKIATFTPMQPLHPGAMYTVEVSGAIDAWENEMVPYTWSFRTIDQAAANWTFDEGAGKTAADSSGNGHNASLSNTAAWIGGKSRNAISNVPSQARIAASQSAATQGKPVEVVDETTATSITYAQPDGKTFKTEVTTGPVRTRQGTGWASIDTTLAEQGGKLRPKAIAEDTAVEISAGGTDPFVKMSVDGKSYALRWPTPLPKPTVKGSVVTYIDAAGVGADLVVTVLPTGFRHEVVLRQRPSKPLELRIGVEDEGLTLSEGKAGRLLLKGKDKKLVASAPQPSMWDGSAKGRHTLAESSKVNTEVATKDGRTELVLKPDHRFLADSATTYPVRIQPLAASTSSEDVTLASTDTVDWPASPGNPIMIAGVQQDQKMRSYLRFPTGSLQGQTVTDAKASLYNFESSACGASVGDGLQVRRVTGAWNIDNLYWANKPAATTEDAQINKAGYDLACSGGAQRLEWNVTGIAQDWAAGAADHGLVVQSPTEGTANNWRYLTASEDTDFNQPPTLTITTSGPVSNPVVSNLAITPSRRHRA